MIRSPGLVAYGHSWITGDGATRSDLALAELTSKGLGLRLINKAVGGSSSKETVAALVAAPPPAAVMYLLMTGLNDARLYGSSLQASRAYAAALPNIFGYFRAAAPQALIVALEQPQLVDYSGFEPHNHGSDETIDRYNRILKRAVDNEPSGRYVTARGWDPATMLAIDGVHPNDAGHAYLARRAVAESDRALEFVSHD